MPTLRKQMSKGEKIFVNIILVLLMLFSAFMFAFGAIPEGVSYYYRTYSMDVCGCEKAMNWHVLSYENTIFDKERFGRRCIYKFLYDMEKYQDCTYFDDSCKLYMIKKGVPEEELVGIVTWNDRMAKSFELNSELVSLRNRPIDNLSDMVEISRRESEIMEQLIGPDLINDNTGVYGYLKMKGCK